MFTAAAPLPAEIRARPVSYPKNGLLCECGAVVPSHGRFPHSLHARLKPEVARYFRERQHGNNADYAFSMERHALKRGIGFIKYQTRPATEEKKMENKTMDSKNPFALAVFGYANSGNGKNSHCKTDAGGKNENPTLANWVFGKTLNLSEEAVRIKLNVCTCDSDIRCINNVFLKTGVVEKVSICFNCRCLTVYLRKGKNLPNSKIEELMQNFGGTEAVSILRYRKRHGVI